MQQELSIHDLKRRKEFVYELNGRYYHLGQNACKVCTDEALIEAFKEYQTKFNMCDFHLHENHYQEVGKEKRDALAMAYRKVSKAAHVSCDDNITVTLDEFIEEFNDTEVQIILEQMEQQNIADCCDMLMRFENQRGLNI